MAILAAKEDYGTRALNAVVDALMAMRTQNSDGKWVLADRGSALDSHDVDSILLTIIKLSSELQPFDRRKIVSDGVFSAIADPKMSPQTLLAEITKAESAVVGIKPKPFVLATYVSIGSFPLNIKRAAWDKAVLTFTKAIPANFSYGGLTRTLQNLNLHRPPVDWTALRVRVMARTPEDALYRATDHLNEIRAIWNLSRNRNVLHGMSSPVDMPVNEILLAPLQTIHYPSGGIASGGFLYQKPFVAVGYPGRPVMLSSRDWAAIRKFEGDVRVQLKRLKYRNEYLALLREYVEILDDADAQSNFLRLWTILEKLTAGVDRAGRTDHTGVVKQASFVWKDRESAKLLLDHLRQVRNNSIHDLKSHDEANTCLFQILRFVHELFLFHLRWAGTFDSFSQASEFLQLTNNRTDLEWQMKLRQNALKFLGHKSRKK